MQHQLTLLHIFRGIFFSCLQWALVPCSINCFLEISSAWQWSSKPTCFYEHCLAAEWLQTMPTCTVIDHYVSCFKNTVSRKLYLFCSVINTSNVTGRHRGLKWKLWAGHRAPSLKRTSHVAIIYHCQLWYRAFSVLCVYSKSGIILTPYTTFVPNFISFAASVV